MGIKLIKPGEYLADVAVMVNGKQRRARRTFFAEIDERPKDTKERADVWMRAWEREQLRLTPDARDRTIEWLVADFLRKHTDKAERTQAAYAARLQHFTDFCSLYGIGYVHQITNAHCVAYYDSLKERFVGEGPNGKWDTFVQMLQHELNRTDSALARNPAAGITRMAVSESARDIWRFTDREVILLDSLLITDADRDAFGILEWTGMRTGELRNLPKSHIDLHAGIIHVKPYKYAWGAWKPKSRRSRRRIPILAQARPMIERLMQTEGELLLGGESIASNYFIHRFERARMKVIKHHPKHRARFEAMREGDKRHWLTPHSYRKTFACRMLEAGLSFDEVRSMLGHSDTYMTELYAEYSDTSLQNVASKIASFFNRDTNRDTQTRKTLIPA